jgi:hypothetical protein
MNCEVCDAILTKYETERAEIGYGKICVGCEAIFDGGGFSFRQDNSKIPEVSK